MNDLAKLAEQLTRCQDETIILTAVIETQPAELQRLRAIKARLMAETRRQPNKHVFFTHAKPYHHLN